MTKPDNPPAFPCPSRIVPFQDGSMRNLNEYESPEYGMTLRDYFAGLALQSIIARNYGGYPSWHVEEAYMYADRMLTERMKPQ